MSTKQRLTYRLCHVIENSEIAHICAFKDPLTLCGQKVRTRLVVFAKETEDLKKAEWAERRLCENCRRTLEQRRWEVEAEL